MCTYYEIYSVWIYEEGVAMVTSPDNKVHGATWVLSVPDGPHVGPMNLAIRVVLWKRLAYH